MLVPQSTITTYWTGVEHLRNIPTRMTTGTDGNQPPPDCDCCVKYINHIGRVPDVTTTTSVFVASVQIQPYISDRLLRLLNHT